jgi:hypothetical protein
VPGQRERAAAPPEGAVTRRGGHECPGVDKQAVLAEVRRMSKVTSKLQVTIPKQMADQ